VRGEVCQGMRAMTDGGAEALGCEACLAAGHAPSLRNANDLPCGACTLCWTVDPSAGIRFVARAGSRGLPACEACWRLDPWERCARLDGGPRIELGEDASARFHALFDELEQLRAAARQPSRARAYKVPSTDVRALLIELEASFAAGPPGETYAGEVADAECHVVAECRDQRVAELLAELLNAYWYAHEDLTVNSAANQAAAKGAEVSHGAPPGQPGDREDAGSATPAVEGPGGANTALAGASSKPCPDPTGGAA